MAKRMPIGLKKINLSDKRSNELEAKRKHWGEIKTINEIIARAFEDWVEVTGSAEGFAHYQTYIMDSEGLLLSTPMLEAMADAQKETDADIVRTFFQNVPRDSVFGLLTQELVDSILKGEAVRIYEG